jgi:putative heme-binding domain-containing protein
LARIPISSLDEDRQLEKLRVIEVAVSRDGKPSAEAAKAIIGELDPLYPAKTEALNRELCQILLALNAPDAVAKTVTLLEQAKTQEEQVLYVHHLRTVTDGWTPEARKAYFSWWLRDRSKNAHAPTIVRWFEEAGINYNDGASFARFLGNFHKDAEKTLKPDETAALQPILAAYVPPGSRQTRRPAPKKHSFVKNWKVSDLEPVLAQASKGRNYNSGKEAYEAAQCILCHKFGSDGGATGPDLTAVSSRFNRHDILDSIIEPSKTVSEQYQNMIIETKDGDQIDGRIIEETNDHVVIQPNPLQPDKQTIAKSDIKGRRPSKLSPMPANLVDLLTQDEILDLIAYLESGGRRDAPAFAK